MPLFFSDLINGAIGSTMLLSLAVMLCAFVFEDMTTVIVGVLAADGIITVPLAIFSLLIGIVLGDIILYSIGSIARTHPRLAHYIDHEFTASFRSWLEDRYTLIIFSGHFVPGLRLTTYVASGFFGRPLSQFMPIAITGGLILGTVLFTISYWFGSLTSEWFSPVRWGIAGGFLLILFFVARHNLLAYRAKRDAMQIANSDVDTHTQ